MLVTQKDFFWIYRLLIVVHWGMIYREIVE